MDDIDMELEALAGVYGDDCTLLSRSPPFLRVLLKPRTADDASQQFVEAVLEIQATNQYPAAPPLLKLPNSKGLSEKRLAGLMNSLRSLTSTLKDEPMLLVICEAAMDSITRMNAPEDDCCFCLFPLVAHNAHGDKRPYMKLMSCFHCFHSDCFGRWWRWLQSNRHDISCQVSSADAFVALCPVCRTPIHATDVAHVQEYLTIDLKGEEEEEGNENAIESSLFAEERLRQARFAEEFAAQQARGGIIEPKRLEVIMPGMYVPATPFPSASVPTPEVIFREVEVASTSENSDASCGIPDQDALKELHPPTRHHFTNNKIYSGRRSGHGHQSHGHAPPERDQGHQKFHARQPRKGKVWIHRGTKAQVDE